MWLVLLRLQPWNGLLESGRKQKISDLDPTFHALYIIIHWSHLGACETHRGRKWDCSQGRGHFHGEPVVCLACTRCTKNPCGVHSGTLGPGVRLLCLQSTDDRHAANFINSGSPLLYGPPPALPLEHMCFASPPGLSSPRALTGGPASLSVNSFLPVIPYQGLQPRPASLRVRATDPDTSTSQALKHHLSKAEPNTPPKVCPFSRCRAPENGTTLQPLTGAKHFSSGLLTPCPAHIHSISGLGQFHLLSLYIYIPVSLSQPGEPSS